MDLKLRSYNSLFIQNSFRFWSGRHLSSNSETCRDGFSPGVEIEICVVGNMGSVRFETSVGKLFKLFLQMAVHISYVSFRLSIEI